jgi:hypothetical protein
LGNCAGTSVASTAISAMVFLVLDESCTAPFKDTRIGRGAAAPLARVLSAQCLLAEQGLVGKEGRKRVVRPPIQLRSRPRRVPYQIAARQHESLLPGLDST